MSALQKQQKQQLRLFTASTEAELYHEADRYGFFSILTKHRDGKKRQKSYRLSDMHTVLPLLDNGCDQWLSQAEFTRPNRRAVNLARVGLAFVDLDYYNCVETKDQDADSVAWAVLEHCSYNHFPPPSLIVASGQGLQVKWIFDKSIPAQALPRWKLLQTTLVGMLADFGADHKAKDVSRVLRVVGTTNTKNGGRCRVIHAVTDDTSGELLRYNFDVLTDSLLHYTREQSQEYKAKQRLKVVSQQEKRIGLKTLHKSQLNWDRLNDLRRLVELRGGVKAGERMTHLFWQLNFLCLSGVVHSSQLYHEARELASQLDTKWYYDKDELSTLYSKAVAYNKGERVTFNGKEYAPLYTPRNSTLIDLFQITDAEQAQLKTIISKDEKRARDKIRDAKRKGFKQTRAEYENAAQDKAQQAKQLRAQGMKQKDIAQALNVSRMQVSRYLKKM